MQQFLDKLLEVVNLVNSYAADYILVFLLVGTGLFFTVRVLVTNTNTQQEDYWSGVEISEEEFFDYIETQFVDEDYYDLIQNQDYLNSL